MRILTAISMFLLAFFAWSAVVWAQAPIIQWQKCIGGSGYDFAYCVRQTTDYGFIVTGTSNSGITEIPGAHGDYDAYVVKLSATGDVLWQKVFGGSGADYSNSIVQTADGGYVFVGSTNSTNGDVTGNHGGYDAWVVKLSATGVIEWQSAMGGSNDEYGYDIKQTADLGYIVAGRSKSVDGNLTLNHGAYDYWVVKLSAVGNLQWQHSYGGTNDDNAMTIRQTTDGGYIVAGDSYSTNGDKTTTKGGEDFWLVKLSDTGSIQWQKSYGGSGSDFAQSVRQTADGGYIVAGGSNSTDGDITSPVGAGDYWVVKLSATGNVTWQRSFGSSADDAANAVEITPDGGYIVAGWVAEGDGGVTGWHGQRDYWLAKLSATGNLQWQKSMGSLGNENAQSVMPCTEGGYIMAGFTSFSGGDVLFNNGLVDMWVVKVALSTNVEDAMLPALVTISPNPVDGTLSVQGAMDVQISIYDLLGRMVASTAGSTVISLSELRQGIYIAIIKDREGKVLLQEKISKQ